MELKDVKVGQRVFVKRNSTAKVEDGAKGIHRMITFLNTLFEVNMAEECKKQNGFYVFEIRDNGTVALGDKDENGVVRPGWGLFDASDFELAEEENKPEEKIDELEEFLRGLASILKDLSEVSSAHNEQEHETEHKRRRGRPAGKVNKKYKKGE